MRKLDIALLTGLVLTVFLSSFAGFAKECDEIRNDSLRLHILANSDSEADQALKLRVRDRILEHSPQLFGQAATKRDAKATAERGLLEIEEIAKEEIARSGYRYGVRAEVVNMYFGTKAYGETSMPAGRYDAVRVYIGEAKGQNWWCVLFPPLCIPAASEKPPVEEQIEHLNQEPRYVPKLAVVEFFEGLANPEEPK